MNDLGRRVLLGRKYRKHVSYMDARCCTNRYDNRLGQARTSLHEPVHALSVNGDKASTSAAPLRICLDAAIN